jgi:hypothetical protein
MRSLAIMALCACTEAPWLNPVEAPADADVAIAAGVAAVERHAPAPVTVPWPDATFVDQDCIQAGGGACTGGGFTNVNRLLGRPCQIYIIVRDRYYESVAHELVHCAIAALDDGLAPDTDPRHEQAAWWDALPAVVADVAAAMEGP